MAELKRLSAGLIAAAMLGTPDHGTETPSERASRRKRRQCQRNTRRALVIK